jgi:hypothetical protein
VGDGKDDGGHFRGQEWSRWGAARESDDGDGFQGDDHLLVELSTSAGRNANSPLTVFDSGDTGVATTRRNFPGMSKQWLQERLRWCLEEIADGKVNSGWSSGDASGQKHIDTNLTPERRRDLILNDLSLLDPVKYPPQELVRVTRTVPSYI